jgi:hypothetical protein
MMLRKRIEVAEAFAVPQIRQPVVLLAEPSDGAPDEVWEAHRQAVAKAEAGGAFVIELVALREDA